MTDRSGTEHDARMDPWCAVALANGDSVLFGFALLHPITGGLAWTRSSAIVTLDAVKGRAATQSGRLYGLGTSVELAAIPSLGLEPWLAFDLLIGQRLADAWAVPPISADPERERRWVTACKMARHLNLATPSFTPAAVNDFLATYQEAYACLPFVRSGRP